MKRKISVALIAAAVLFAFTPPAEPYFEIAKNLDLFTTLFREINAYYVDEVDPKSLVQTGIEGMLESLDPYTDFIPEEDREAFSIQTTGQYAGIGALISTLNNHNVVTHPYENFPAHRAGIRVGDEIVAVDGKNVRGKTTRETSILLKGNPGSEVSVTIDRQGKELTFKLTREQIKINNVTYQGMLDHQIGYIKMEEFTPGASREVEAALGSLRQQGARRFILDLRDNPGGLMYEAINIVNLFIPKGKQVVSTKGKVREWNKSYSTLNAPVDLETPLVVLIDGGSASASEIVAGALQDYDRAVLVGQKTYGKGLVQTTRHLPYEAQVKVTTARYHIPSGRCIQALDFAHRQKDGSVRKFADSLKQAFKTTSGRTVYDGGGLDPDILVARAPYGAALIQLAQSGLLFEYANKYCAERTAPASFVNFSLSDKEFSDFDSWLKTRKFVYTTDLETQVSQLLGQASEDHHSGDLKTTLETMKGKIAENHAGYLIRFRDEIQPLLEEEIGFHMALHRGRVEASLDHDKDLLEAKRILANEDAYRQLLRPR
ncbi:MAG: S41 family peptidase [Cyclobacteriaceae bacterium]|nr:S41 family peptidase [Cyclobacteriaceae bacterium]